MNRDYDEEEQDLPEPFDSQEAAEQAFERVVSNELIAAADDIVREMQMGGPLVDYAAKLRVAAVDALYTLATLDYKEPDVLKSAQNEQNAISDYIRICQHVAQTIEAGDSEQDEIINN